MAEYWNELVTVSTIYLLGLISPGPDCALILKTSLLQNFKRSILTSLGIASGVALHASFCLLGAGVLISSSPKVSFVIRTAGALYMIYLGWQGINTPRPNSASDSGTISKAQPLGLDGLDSKSNESFKFWSEGFLTTLLNPKGILFILGIFTQIVNPSTPPGIQLIYITIMFASCMLWFSVLSYTLIRSQEAIRIDQLQYYALKLMGVALVALGVKVGLGV